MGRAVFVAICVLLGPFLGSGSAQDLAQLNKAISQELRPVGADLYTRWVFKGFPAVRSLKLEMVLRFEDGTQLRCSDWAPLGAVSPKKLAQTKDCVVKGDKSEVPLYGFEPGQTLAVDFGRTAGVSFDGLAGSAGGLSGGDLKMTADGQIAIGRWTANTVTGTGAGATSVKTGALVGRYYLDGNTITIRSTDGGVAHGFIAYSLNDENRVESVFLNGDRYWSRD